MRGQALGSAVTEHARQLKQNLAVRTNRPDLVIRVVLQQLQAQWENGRARFGNPESRIRIRQPHYCI